MLLIVRIIASGTITILYLSFEKLQVNRFELIVIVSWQSMAINEIDTVTGVDIHRHFPCDLYTLMLFEC